MFIEFSRMDNITITKKIIIFGAGKYFRVFVHKYPMLSERVKYIIDNDNVKQGTCLSIDVDGREMKFDICSVDNLLKEELNTYIVLFCAQKWEAMKSQIDGLIAQNYDFSNFVPSTEDITDKSVNYIERMVYTVQDIISRSKSWDRAISVLGLRTKEEFTDLLLKKQIIVIPRLVVVLTPKCSLKCKDCNNLIWAFKQLKDLDSNRIIESLNNIINCVDMIGMIELIGGEAFLARDLHKVLGYLKEQNKILNIEITTNATVIPSEAILKELKHDKCSVNVSNYGRIVNQQPFIDILYKNNIRTIILPMEEWVSPGGVNKRNRDYDTLMKQYFDCVPSYKCKTLWGDRVYPCARAASLAQLGIYKECTFVDVRKTERLKERLIDFYAVPNCGPCDYCDMEIEPITYVEPAVQIEREY